MASEHSSERRRWRLAEVPEGQLTCEVGKDSPHGIDVMPVAEHEAALFEAFVGGIEAVVDDRTLSDESKRQLFEEWQHRDDEAYWTRDRSS